MIRMICLLPILLIAASLTGCPQQQPPVASSRGAKAQVTPAPAPQSITPAVAMMQPMPVTPTWQPVVKRTVILDAGHGGNDLGAAYFGMQEKDVNLALVNRTATILRSMGVNVLQTRSTDVFIPLPDRSSFANKNPNAIFVSIHCNASDKNPQARGIETFILSRQFTDDEQCRRALAKYNVTGKEKNASEQELDKLTRVCRAEGPLLAASMQRSLTSRLGDPDRGIKPENLAVLRETFFCPAVLVEVGFISNYATAQKMAAPTWRDQTAQAIAEGVVNYLRKGG